jgi:hypothetical protein
VAGVISLDISFVSASGGASRDVKRLYGNTSVDIERKVMQTALRVGSICLCSLCCNSLERAVAVTANQVDAFQDGTAMGWEEGAASPNPPQYVASGGPEGEGDGFLRNASGGFSSGSMMVMYNTSQWSGDYLSEGISRIGAQLVNLGTNSLAMRIALGRGPFAQTAAWYASTAAFSLPADQQWKSVFFELNPEHLTLVNGAESLADVMSDVTALRMLSAAAGPDFRGDTITAILGVDNLTAIVIGDMDADDDVDFDDTSPFVLGLTDAEAYEMEFGLPPVWRGDTNRDAELDFDDIAGYVAILSNGHFGSYYSAIPEPCTWELALLAVVAYGAAIGGNARPRTTTPQSRTPDKL